MFVSAAPNLNGRIVGLSGGTLSGLPSNPASTIVASTSDSTKNECQCVYEETERNMKSNKSFRNPLTAIFYSFYLLGFRGLDVTQSSGRVDQVFFVYGFCLLI